MQTAALRVSFQQVFRSLEPRLTHTGVSLITQVLYALVFCTRYLDIFTTPANADGWHTWNFSLKVLKPGRTRDG